MTKIKRRIVMLPEKCDAMMVDEANINEDKKQWLKGYKIWKNLNSINYDTHYYDKDRGFVRI